MDLEQVNSELTNKSPQDIIDWAMGLGKRTIVTTTFGPFSSVILHMVTRKYPDIPVVWIDSGYNTHETYVTAEKLMKELDLNMHIFTPIMTAARRDAILNGIPEVNSDEHRLFTWEVKLEPFDRVMKTMQPEVWLTAIRKDETDFRKTLDIVTTGPNGIIKVAPLFNWTELDMEEYLYGNELPQVERYYDPTKGQQGRECGLHTMN
ncbi:MAG: phosphoadenosine phosphosulfate reductase family protein [Gammaproteobacteria bacterium]|nr:phosphoadenosine phosphosulfate reductase family protein [Gammaproteobacteria bacterium]